MNILDEALARIGRSGEELRELLGSLLEGNPAYLVGSLAAGFGNVRSDVDVHIIDQESRATGVPAMFFLGRSIVDVVHHRPAEVSGAAAQLAETWAPMAGGICGCGSTISRKDQKRLGRWWSSMPLNVGDPPLFDADLGDRVTATNARGALAEFFVYAAIAEMIEMHADDQAIAAGAWRRVALAYVELLARSRGESFVGDKWVWRKAQRAGLPGSLIDDLDRVRTRSGLRRAMADDLAAVEPLDLVVVAPEPGESIDLGLSSVLLVVDRVVPAGGHVATGSVREEIDRLGAAGVLEALTHQTAHLLADDAGLDAVLA